VDGDEVELRTRNGNVWTENAPGVVKALSTLGILETPFARAYWCPGDGTPHHPATGDARFDERFIILMGDAPTEPAALSLPGALPSTAQVGLGRTHHV
jgi:hypothetical protein